MDFLKKGMEMYNESQGNVSKTGGAEYNRPAGDQHGSGSASPDFDEGHAMQTAQAKGLGDTDMFSQAMSFISNNKGAKHEGIDEQEAVQAHRAAYEEGSGASLNSSQMGSAAALKALKSFMGGGGTSSSSEKDQTSSLITMAVQEAVKLFNQSGGASSGNNKQDVVNSAAMTAMKFMVQSKMSGMMGGGNSGGLSGLMSMASKFA